MKRLFVSDNRILVLQLREFLQENHIRCIVRNEYLGGAAGELPPTECWPELWILENQQLEKAEKLLDAFRHPPTGDAGDSQRPNPWTCERCAEILEPQFSQCWHCGYERPLWELLD